MKKIFFLLLISTAILACAAPGTLSVKVVTECNQHPTLGIICEQNIVYQVNGVEVSRESYTEDHPFYSWNFDSLSKQEVLLIKQHINL